MDINIKKGDDLLSHLVAVPSALMGLTSLFGMVRGEPHCNNHLKSFSIFQLYKLTYGKMIMCIESKLLLKELPSPEKQGKDVHKPMGY